MGRIGTRFGYVISDAGRVKGCEGGGYGCHGAPIGASRPFPRAKKTRKLDLLGRLLFEKKIKFPGVIGLPKGQLFGFGKTRAQNGLWLPNFKSLCEIY
jgi:hypothetical protein